MKQAFIYSRVSTEEQAKEGLSIEAQIRICREYAQNNDLEIAQIFVDEGKSATNMNRPGLQDMLGICQDKTNQVKTILVQDGDRLDRNTFDHLKIKALLRKHEVTLISVSQPMIDDSPEGNLIDTLLAATNAFQSQITGRKTSKVMEQKAQFGWYPGGMPPLGYRNADNPNSTCSLDRRIIVIDEEPAIYIKDIFKKYAEGNISGQALADYLNEHGVKSKFKTKIHPSFINNTLHNPFYIGQFYWHGKLYTGKHEPLISEELFDRVQQVIDINNKGATRKRIHFMLLRGFLFYLDTQKQMWGEVRLKGGKEFRYYYCKKAGKGSYISADDIEKQVEKIFQKIQISEEYKQEVMATAEQLLKEARSTREDDRQRLQKEKAKYQQAISEAEDDRYIRHTIGSEELMRIIDKYKPLFKKVDQELASLEIDHSERLESLERILTLAEDIGAAYQKASPQLKKEYLQLFFKHFWVKEGKIVKYDLTPDLKGLIEAGSVRVRPNGLPDEDSNLEP